MSVSCSGDLTKLPLTGSNGKSPLSSRLHVLSNFWPSFSLNQWVLLELLRKDDRQLTNNISMTLVTLECVGVLVGEKGAQIVEHVEAVWARGQQAVDLLRQELPLDLVDTLAPLRNGGVHLQKIFGVMHDTCHAANKVASLMVELREVKARQFHGDDKWDDMAPSAKACFDFLCGNHTRILPIDWFNRLYNRWLVTEIGEAVKTAKSTSGGTVRLECNGEAFLRRV